MQGFILISFTAIESYTLRLGLAQLGIDFNKVDDHNIYM